MAIIDMGSIRQRLRSLRSPGALKGYFFVVGAVLTVAFLFDAQRTVRDLQKTQREIISSYGVYLITRAASEDVSDGSELGLLLNRIQKMEIPIIVTDEDGIPTAWKGVDIPQEIDDPDDPEVMTRLRELVTSMDAETVPVPFDIGPGVKMLLHYHYSPAVRRMRWFPYVEIGVAALFISLSLLVYRNLKLMEQRHIWIGMARETAHQFGTPLSALMGWLELIKVELEPEGSERRASRRKFDQIVEEMTGDITRLNKIASRFSQIGSVPELHSQDIRTVIADSVDYFRKRLPQQGKRVEIQESYTVNGPLLVDINRELLEWVFENLLKNALDAIDMDIGLIQVDAHPTVDRQYVMITIEDNGKGIPVHAYKKVFDPGYTTKKRGWGLGLSLARRIIEEYHRGKLMLRESRPGKTVFEIVLPVSQ